MHSLYTYSLFGLFYLGTFGCFGQGDLWNVSFSEIDSLHYEELKLQYTNALVLDTNQRTSAVSGFHLEINGELEFFGCKPDYTDCYYYKGYLPTVGYYVVSHCGSLVCETFLIQKKTGEKIPLFSPYDNECQTPLMSYNQDFMLVVVSDVYDRESHLAIYQKSKETQGFSFDSFKAMTTTKWRIYEAIWVDDTHIALMTYDTYGGLRGDKPLEVKYLIATF